MSAFPVKFIFLIFDPSDSLITPFGKFDKPDLDRSSMPDSRDSSAILAINPGFPISLVSTGLIGNGAGGGGADNGAGGGGGGPAGISKIHNKIPITVHTRVAVQVAVCSHGNVQIEER